MARIGPDLRR